MNNLSRKVQVRSIASLIAISMLSGCLLGTDEEGQTIYVNVPTSSDDSITSGDIIVSNFGTKSVIALDSSGNYKRTLYSDLVSNGMAPYGLAYNSSTQELLVAVDGTSDFIVAIDIATGDQRTFYIGGVLSGNIRDIAISLAGEVAVVETNAFERFNLAGTSLGNANPTLTTISGIKALSAGGYVACATAGTNNLKTLSSIFATVNQVTVATNLPYDCMELDDGTIGFVQSGATDGVSIRTNGAGLPQIALYDNGAGGELSTAVLSDPRGMTQRANGNILVSDYAYHHIVEMTSSGVYIDTLGGDVLNQPMFMVIIP